MKRKLRSQRGFTLTEALVAVAILGLIGVALAAGIPTALRVYRSVTANAEANVLCSTLSTAIADELRFAKDVKTTESGVQFASATFGQDVMFNAVDGHIRVGESELLSSKAYTGSLTAALTEFEYSDGCFHVVIHVKEADSVLAKADLYIRPLNQ